MAKRDSWVATAGRLINALIKPTGSGARAVKAQGNRRKSPSTRGQTPSADSRSTAAPSARADGRATTIEVNPTQVRDLRPSYAPDRDGDPDAGEIVWTWVPYAENDGRGKDRPVLVIARHSADRMYAVKLTSKSHDGDREYVPIGSGAWDREHRESWVDLDQLYSVHVQAMRREAAALDRGQFDRVTAELQRRFGWAPID